MTSLLDIGIAMNNQDNRSTQFPVFVVQSLVKHYVGYEMDYDGRERKEDIRQDSSRESGYLCSKCDEIYLEQGSEEVPEDCEDCPHYCFNYYKEEYEFNLRAAFFFTAAACDEHIRRNPHHYSKSARSYAISAYYNPELKNVMEKLSEMGSVDGPKSQYKI